MGEHAGRRLFRLPVLRGRGEREPELTASYTAIAAHVNMMTIINTA